MDPERERRARTRASSRAVERETSSHVPAAMINPASANARPPRKPAPWHRLQIFGWIRSRAPPCSHARLLVPSGRPRNVLDRPRGDDHPSASKFQTPSQAGALPPPPHFWLDKPPGAAVLARAPLVASGRTRNVLARARGDAQRSVANARPPRASRRP